MIKLKEIAVTILIESKTKEQENEDKVIVAYSDQATVSGIIEGGSKNDLVSFFTEVIERINDDEIVTIFSNIKSMSSLYLNKYYLEGEINSEVYERAINAITSKIRNIIFSDLKYSKQRQKADIALTLAKQKTTEESIAKKAPVAPAIDNSLAIAQLTAKLTECLTAGQYDEAQKITEMIATLTQASLNANSSNTNIQEENTEDKKVSLRDKYKKQETVEEDKTARDMLADWVD